MGFRKEFKEFALKGNVMDMAIGIIIGAAFGKIVNSLVADLIMPVIGLLLPSGDWRNLAVIINDMGTADPTDDAKIAYGKFLSVTLEFLVIAMVLFWMVKAMNRMRRKDEAKEAAK